MILKLKKTFKKQIQESKHKAPLLLRYKPAGELFETISWFIIDTPGQAVWVNHCNMCGYIRLDNEDKFSPADKRTYETIKQLNNLADSFQKVEIEDIIAKAIHLGEISKTILQLFTLGILDY